jgi:hypothetical protein
MLKRFCNKSGQSISAEIVITFLVVIVAATAMATYVRRAMQGRTRDLVIYARDEAAGVLGDGNVVLQYEPYYVNSIAQADQQSTATININATGGYNKNSFTDRAVFANNEQLPPKDW